MRYKTLGKTGLNVSVATVGTWAIGGSGWGAVDRQEDFLRRQTQFLEEQLRTFERYMDESHESARSAWRWSLASLVVAGLSLAVAAIALLQQFGVLG